MPNNWRKTPSIGGWYIGKDGDASPVIYNGTNLEDARNNPTNVLPDTEPSQTLIINGHYVLTQDTNYSSFIHLIGDGKTVIDGQGLYSLVLRSSDDPHENLLIKNCILSNNADRSGKTYRNCIFLDCLSGPNTQGTNYNFGVEFCVMYSTQGVIDSVRLGLVGSGAVPHVEDSTFYNMNTLIDSILRVDRNIFFSDGVCMTVNDADVDLGRFANNGFRGQIVINGTTYNSISDPGLVAAFPDFAAGGSQGNFQITQSASECFNNAEQGDFSLRSGSQAIKEQFTAGGIGFRFAKYAGLDAELTQPNLSINPDGSSNGTTNIRVHPGSDFTTLTSDAILADQVNGAEIELNIIDLVSQVDFDSDISQPQAGRNENVPIVTEYADGTQGANPRRLTFEVRTSQNASTNKPSSDSDYDNSFLVTAGTWISHEFNNEAFSLDNIGRGKGDLDYDPDLEQLFFRCVWFQVRITLQDNI